MIVSSSLYHATLINEQIIFQNKKLSPKTTTFRQVPFQVRIFHKKLTPFKENKI